MSRFVAMASLKQRFYELKQSWIVIWSLFSIPLALLLLLSQDYKFFWLIMGQFALAILTHFFVVPRSFLSKTLLLMLILSAFLSALGWYFGTRSFRVTDHFWEQVMQLSPYETLERQGSQSWLLKTTENLSWNVEARLADGFTDWDWGRSDPSFSLSRKLDSEGVYTQVDAPASLPAKAHISQNYFLDDAIEGRTFKLLLETRFVTPTAQTQAFVLTSGGGRFPLSASSDWSLLEEQWTVQGNQTTELRVILMDLQGAMLDLRLPKVFELVNGEWVDLSSALGVGLRLRADNASLITYKGFTPSENWQTYVLEIPQASLNSNVPLVTQVDIAEGLKIQLRNSNLVTQSQSPALKWRDVRQKLWFPNENLAGHSFTAIGLVFLSVVQAFPAALLGFIMLLVAVLLTGSRTALVVALLGGLVLLSLKAPKQYRRFLSVLALVILVLMAGVFTFPEALPVSLRALSTEQEVSRLLIWRTAFTASLDYPFGLPERDFTSFFAAQYPDLPSISHAHNFWLDFTAKYGIVGLLCSILLSFSMIYMVWKWAKWQGLIFILSMFMLQVFDFSLFYNIVFISLILGINQLEPKTLKT